MSKLQSLVAARAKTRRNPMTDSSNGVPKMVTGLFRDRESVERAYRCVTERGYDTGEVSVVMSDDTRQRYFSGDRQIDTELGSKAAEGGELGGPTGGTIGTVIPALVAAGGLLAFPALGFVLAGPLAAALAGAGAAGLTFGLIGALGDWGIPEERSQQYEAGIREGAILMGVKPRSAEDARYFEQQWKASGAQHVHS
jgi:hypothetical protein